MPYFLSPTLQDLIQLICNIQEMEDTVIEMKYDTRRAPLGEPGVCDAVVGKVCPYPTLPSHRLSPSLPSPLPPFPSGKLTEEQIMAGYKALKRIEDCIQGGELGDPLVRACDEFYTRIPHSFG